MGLLVNKNKSKKKTGQQKLGVYPANPFAEILEQSQYLHCHYGKPQQQEQPESSILFGASIQHGYDGQLNSQQNLEDSWVERKFRTQDGGKLAS